jgi:hypothetical protein
MDQIVGREHELAELVSAAVVGSPRLPFAACLPIGSSPVRALLARAGIRPGHRILDVGALLYDHEMSPQELREFQVFGLDEDVAAADVPRLRPVRETTSFRLTVRNIQDVHLLGASFDAVVALDWWPSIPLTEVVVDWRRILNPAGGVAVVAGTDVSTGDGTLRGASRQWCVELDAAGFRLETMTDEVAVPEQYRVLTDGLRRVSEPLRRALGSPVADSYTKHVEQLDRVARRGWVRRFEIVARL